MEPTYNNEPHRSDKAGDRFYVEAIKLAAGSVQYKNISVQKLLIESIRRLYNYYIQFENKRYLETALLHIQAYLEMGFSYMLSEKLFDDVLNALNLSREIKFPSKMFVSKQIPLNKQSVRGMIRRWPASPHQNMKINDVVEDIIRKVSKKETGIFYYKCSATKEVYELVINEDEMFFHDLQRGVFYTFK